MRRIAAFAAITLLAACAATNTAMTQLSPHDQVVATERAFAATMAQRDFDAFATFIDVEAVFIETPEPLRGKDAVLAAWKGYFDGDKAPFAWEPDQVEVLASGTLAHSSGPVLDPAGKPIARFNSIWRRKAPGVWKIVFDKGSKL